MLLYSTALRTLSPSLLCNSTSWCYFTLGISTLYATVIFDTLSN